MMQVTTEILKPAATTFRLRPATMDDLDAVAALLTRSALDQIGRPFATAAEIAEDWKMDMFDLSASTRVAETAEGQMIGYVEVWDINPVPVQNFVWARVDPDFEGHGVGTALMSWSRQRLQRTLARVPDDARVTMNAAALTAHAPSHALFTGLGMTRVRRFWHMMIQLDSAPPQPVWPQGIRLVTYRDYPDLLAIYRADMEAFRDHWGHVEQPEKEGFEQWRQFIEARKDLDPTLWFLAMDGDEIAGICLCTRERTEYPGAAWVNVLAVRRPWRGQGLGLALLHHAFGVFYDEGKQAVGLGVDSSNLTGATRLYEKAGMSVIKEEDFYELELRPGREYRRTEEAA